MTQKTVIIDENVMECLKSIKEVLNDLPEEKQEKTKRALQYISDVFEGLPPKPCPPSTEIIMGGG
ncbi:MAG: hypothetical protein JXB26_00515 [Candidatus Aminicenantes bacterium]|nr:hypothetical protein [Candidatus Aminicenantes bacterium]